MSIEQEKQVNSQEPDLLCVSCKRFFGSPATKQMCSQCFKQYPIHYSETRDW